MSEKKERKPYRIIGAYDTETTNISSFGGVRAFPVLHQIGLINPDLNCETITADNVEQLCQVSTYRHTDEVYSVFNTLIQKGNNEGFVPVVMVHNLGFDMYSLANYLNSYTVRPLAKSNTKPISFTILDDENNPALVFWDTLGFYGKPLGVMGSECGYSKLVGSWDYDLIRTPETPLTDEELNYAKADINVMFAYLGYYLRSNPLIDVEQLGNSIVTKTGAVRSKRKTLFNTVKGKKLKNKAGKYWNYQNRINAPNTDDELYTMHACTRGGFTFCASSFAGKPLNLSQSNLVVAGYDASSQHPAQMVSHYYPEQFEKATKEQLELAIKLVQSVTTEKILNRWFEPFTVAFNACFEFKNLRLKENSLFKKYGISPLAWARVRNLPHAINEDNQASSDFKNMIEQLNYRDTTENDLHAFGKIVSCDSCKLFLTELAFWEVSQCFDYDSVEPINGYISLKFCKPTDFSILSVMTFFKNKDIFKRYKEKFDKREPLGDTKELRAFCPASLVDSMESGSATDSEVKDYYQTLKADLNALFGIEATNEYRAEQQLTEWGIETLPPAGLDNAPKHNKTWYQFGQRIVGWSRIAQIVVMQLAEPYINGVINGDTDSVKFLIKEENIPDLNCALEKLSTAIDKGKEISTNRIKTQYPDYFTELKGIGHYECEFIVKKFCASWNKCYAIQEFDKKKNGLAFKFTIAGITTDAGEHSYNNLADYLYNSGVSFEDICSILLGYNVNITSSITQINGRKIPVWGSYFADTVTDYLGNTSQVFEPNALALYPMAKTIGAFDNEDNYINHSYAVKNNEFINSKPVIIDWSGKEPEIIYL